MTTSQSTRMPGRVQDNLYIFSVAFEGPFSVLRALEIVDIYILFYYNQYSRCEQLQHEGYKVTRINGIAPFEDRFWQGRRCPTIVEIGHRSR